jgi:hypothetical protein
MGLEITAYRGLQPSPEPREPQPVPEEGFRLSEFCDLRNCLKYTEETFPGRTATLRPDMSYDSCAEAFEFRVGSCTVYGVWRNRLAWLAGYGCAEDVWNDPKPGPFVELIDFSDCNGLIGPVVSAKLAKDFAEYEPKAVARGNLEDEADDWFLLLYRKWRRAFELAADNGMVLFGG